MGRLQCAKRKKCWGIKRSKSTGSREENYMIYAMTCADSNYMPCAEFHMKTAKKRGKVDKTIICNIEELDEEFRNRNQKILSSGEGRRRGFYIWKPYYVNKVLSQLQYGDFLIYLDSAGFYYRNDVHEIVSYMIENNIDMVGTRRFSYLDKHWTRRDTFVYMGCDTPEYTDKRQCMGGCFILQKTEKTVKLIQEWIDFAQNYQIIADTENTCGLDNYNGFVAHRHDQSIMSILQTKYHVVTIEEIPVADFYVYHHTMETSVRRVKKQLAKIRREQIKKSIQKKDIKNIYYIERERYRNISCIQRRRRLKFSKS